MSIVGREEERDEVLSGVSLYNFSFVTPSSDLSIQYVQIFIGPSKSPTSNCSRRSPKRGNRGRVVMNDEEKYVEPRNSKRNGLVTSRPLDIKAVTCRNTTVNPPVRPVGPPPLEPELHVHRIQITDKTVLIESQEPNNTLEKFGVKGVESSSHYYRVDRDFLYKHGLTLENHPSTRPLFPVLVG